VKRATAGRTALQGGIDTDLLIRGTPAAVRAETERVMAILKPGGGYVCAPDQTIPGVPPENLEALWTTARAAGRY
jgi:uroporphyrinogen decarboxylase